VTTTKTKLVAKDGNSANLETLRNLKNLSSKARKIEQKDPAIRLPTPITGHGDKTVEHARRR
jgi:HAMP domain-containing protein